MNARGMDPVTGRFLQIDPLMQFASPYVYAGNNPVSLTDPTGMSTECNEGEKEEDCRARQHQENVEEDNQRANQDAQMLGAGWAMGSTAGRNKIKNASSGNPEEGSTQSQTSYNTEYGIFIESTFFESSENDSYETKEQKRQMLQLLKIFGEDIKKAFGPDGIYENVLVFFHLSQPLTLERSSSNENATALVSWGNRGSSYKALNSGSETKTANFGISDLVIDVRINPNKLRSESGNTAMHEFVHVLLIASFVNNNEPVLKGGRHTDKGNDTQHGIINSYTSYPAALRDLFGKL